MASGQHSPHLEVCLPEGVVLVAHLLQFLYHFLGVELLHFVERECAVVIELLGDVCPEEVQSWCILRKFLEISFVVGVSVEETSH